jgi:hypothetical protein
MVGGVCESSVLVVPCPQHGGVFPLTCPLGVSPLAQRPERPHGEPVELVPIGGPLKLSGVAGELLCRN